MNPGSGSQKKLQSAVFEVDVNEHMGESDAEMVAMIEGSLKKVIDHKIDGDAQSIQVNTMNTLGTRGAHYSSTAFTMHDKGR